MLLLHLGCLTWLICSLDHIIGSLAETTTNLCCSLSEAMELLLLESVVGEGQLIFLLLKCFRVEEQCLSGAHRVLAYLFHVSICEDVLLDVKDGDSLVDRLL